jgi:hypothetical protein
MMYYVQEKKNKFPAWEISFLSITLLQGSLCVGYLRLLPPADRVGIRLDA